MKRGVLAVLVVLAPLPARAQVFEYYHLDSVGSVRAVTDAAGALVERHDYLPFGEEWQPAPAPQPLRFTGQERDPESGLDYFGARYMRAGLGRFTTFDPVLDADVATAIPQAFNRYAYALNNPLRFLDPAGAVVDLSALDSTQRGAVINDLNAFTGNTYETNAAGQLQLLATGAGSSPTATEFLNDAIGSGNIYPVTADASKATLFAVSDTNTKAIKIDFGDFERVAYGEVDPRAYGLGAALVHELGHTHGKLSDPSPEMQTTLVGDNEDLLVNAIRSERGLPTRGPAYAGSYGGFWGNKVKINFQHVDPKKPNKIFHITLSKE